MPSPALSNRTLICGPVKRYLDNSVAISIPSFLILRFVLFHHLGHYLGTLVLPFGTVLLRIVQVLITRDAKHTTVVQLFGQGNNVKVEKANFTLVPKVSGVCALKTRREVCETKEDQQLKA